MKLNDSNYKQQIDEYFNYSLNFDFLDIIADILDRIEDFNDDDSIYYAIDEALIYTCDQWTVLEEYCTPMDASWDVAYTNLCDDIYGLLNLIKGDK